MSELGKDPRCYSIRSIRQGGSSSACELEMPELFLRASGGWKGNALERYRKDRLPTEQERFATLLSRLTTRTDGDASDTPGNLCGPFGSGGVQPGQTTPRRPPTWQAVFSREEVVERCCRRRAVSQRRRPNAVVLILSSAPLFMMLPYGQRSGMERGVLKEGRRDTNLAAWETSMERGSFPLIIENRL